MNIRLAKTPDAAELHRIYAQYIDTAVTFEYTLPTAAEFTLRMETYTREFPCLVCEDAGQIAGYACAHRQMERAAYQWNAELSVYLDAAYTSRGFGKRLYACLMEILRLQGVKTVYGGVTVPNEKSEKLHEGLGFTRLGTYHNTGYKAGAWHDVAWFEKQLAPYDTDPAPVLPIDTVPKDALEAILAAHSF